MKKAIYFKDAQLFLDECIKTRETVKVVAMKKDGTLRTYNGWIVVSSHWRGGTHTLMNPHSKQLRKILDILIFKINDHPIYL